VPRVRRAVTILVLASLAIVLVGYGVASAVVWDQLTRVSGDCHPEWADNDPTAFSYPGIDTTPYAMPAPEEVTIPSRDTGIDISGWWVPADDAPADDAPARAVVIVHGHGACRRDHDVLLPAGMLHRHGISVLLIDMRDHGDSTDEDGRYAGGTEEYRDVLGAWDWLRSEQGLPVDRIGLLGVSLGAATALIATGEEPAVAATWEDSSYADIGVAIQAELARNGYPGFLEAGGIAMAQLLSGDDLRSRSPLNAVRKMSGRSLYITHGTDDARLSVDYGRTLSEAARQAGVHVTTWIVPGAGHTKAMGMQPDEYESRLVGFFSESLGR
jgi:dipeptidyl aminopeptidase/acylaminoacyl peptidase